MQYADCQHSPTAISIQQGSLVSLHIWLPHTILYKVLCYTCTQPHENVYLGKARKFVVVVYWDEGECLVRCRVVCASSWVHCSRCVVQAREEEAVHGQPNETH